MSGALRSLFLFILVLVIFAIERNFGLPFFSLFLGSVFVVTYSGYQRLWWWGVVALFFGVIFHLPVVMSMVSFLVVLASLEIKIGSFGRDSVKVFGAVILISVFIAIFSRFSWNWSSVLFHFFSAAVLLVAIRYWFGYTRLRSSLRFVQKVIRK